MLKLRIIMRWLCIVVILLFISTLIVVISGSFCVYTSSVNSMGEVTRNCGLPIPFRYDYSGAAWSAFNKYFFIADIFIVSSIIAIVIWVLGRNYDKKIFRSSLRKFTVTDIKVILK